jgi:SAM-dependent methyltransferase
MSSHDLAELSRDWTQLGEQDPLWAVCVDSAKRGGLWQVEDFLATGQSEIASAMARLADLGLCAARRDALDFGCGVGRLTAALSSHFDSVIGVDIAPSMIDHARRMHRANRRCRFLFNDQPDLSLFDDDSFDLVYSGLVLQHMAPALADSYLREFARVVRPGGAIVLLVPEAHRRSPRGLVYAYVPRRIVGWLQVAVFGYPAPIRMEKVPVRRIGGLLEGGQACILDSEPYPIPGCHWRMSRHYIKAGHQRDG